MKNKTQHFPRVRKLSQYHKDSHKLLFQYLEVRTKLSQELIGTVGDPCWGVGGTVSLTLITHAAHFLMFQLI